MMMARSTLAVLIALGAAGAAPRAQSPLPADPVTPGSMTIGPVALSPRFEILNVGTDSNVFNEAEGPREDFTATFKPGLDLGLRFGPGRLTYRGWLEAVYFHEYESERAVNRFAELRAELRLTRLVPFVFASGLETTDRPNTEIDLRSDRTLQIAGGGVAAAILSRTALVASARRETLRYAEDQFVDGEDLADQLNQERDVFEGALRVALTPLTTFSLRAAHEDIRFERSPDRDATSFRIGPQLDFDATALISGTAAFGYRKFTPESGTLRPFEGFVTSVDVRYTSSSTAVAVRVFRDLDYSYQDDQPYYITTGGSLTVTQRIAGPVDLQGKVTRERLAYEPRDLGPETEPRIETVENSRILSAGVGYRFRENTRLGLNLEFATREAARDSRQYDRRRILASITYGF